MAVLKSKHISEALRESYAYIEGRKNGTIEFRKTKFQKLNKLLNGGAEDNSIIAISAMSGGGKTALAQVLMQSIIDCNPTLKVMQQMMSFEMVAKNIASRSAVTGCNISLGKLYSVEEPLSDLQLRQVFDYYKQLGKQDTYIIDCAGTPKDIRETMQHAWEIKCKDSGKFLITLIDHVKLVKKSSTGQPDVEMLDEMMTECMGFKKWVSERGGKSLQIVLSQMNRDIKKDSRVLNAEMHVPDCSVLYGGSSIEFACDQVIVVHNPAKLGITSYTTNNLPTWYTYKDNKFMMTYMEVIKNRSGGCGTIPLLNYLARFNFEEMKTESFKDLVKQFHESKCKDIPVLNKFK